MVTRLAVLDRGVPGLRLVRAVRELDAEHGRRTTVVALHEESERRSRFVRAADEGVLLPAATSDQDARVGLAELGRALQAAGADAAWVTGPLSLDPGLTELCARLGVTLIGPGPDVLHRLSGPTPGPGRRVDVQVLADAVGTVWAPGLRVHGQQGDPLVESASPELTPEQDAGLRRRAGELAAQAGLVGVATVAFLLAPDDGPALLLGGTAGLPPDHAVTEATTGLDLAKLAVELATGGRLGAAPGQVGHAMQVTVRAQGLLGTVELLDLPSGPGLRVDCSLAVGERVPGGDLVTVTAWGRDRPEALARLRCALRDSTVVLSGGGTSRSALLAALDGPHHAPDRVGARAALIAAAVDVYDAEQAQERRAFLASARGGRPRAGGGVGRDVELSCDGVAYRVTVEQTGAGRYRLELDGGAAEVDMDRLGPFRSRLAVGGQRFDVVATVDGTSHLTEVDGVAHLVTSQASEVVRASSPAVVVAVRPVVGQAVEAGEVVAVLESMKLETPVRTPYAGRVRELLVAVNASVDAGDPLLRLDRGDRAAPVADGARLTLPEAGPTRDEPRAAAAALLQALQALITGYDVSAGRARTLVRDYVATRAATPPDDPGLLHGELAVLTTFADLCELTRNRPTIAEEAGDEQVHSPREHLHTFLQSLDDPGDTLPAGFRTRLVRVLEHYGVTGLVPGRELDEAAHRVFLAQQRAPAQLPAVSALLDRWLDGPGPAGTARGEVLEVLDRLVVATQLRFPAIGDLARAVRFRHFEQPLVRAARRQVLSEAEQLLDALAEDPDAADGAERMDALVASPEPLIQLLAQRFGGVGPEPALEALTRRYYRIRQLQDVRSSSLAGRPCVTGAFELQGVRLRLVALMVGAPGDLSSSLASLGQLVDGAADPLVLDLYVLWPDRPADPDELSERLREVLEAEAPLRAARRVTVTVCTADDTEHLTFRPSAQGLAEERLIRGLHPLTGQRLDLWRLKEFEGERLPSTEDTYLFHLTAKGNAADERLVAMAEVRDVTPLRDASGAVVGFPTAERMLAACLDGMRRLQAQRGGSRRLSNNRVFLYAWPSLEVPLAEVEGFLRASAPLTVGAGLDQIVLLTKVQEPGAEPRRVALRFSFRPGADAGMTVTDPPTEPMRPLDDYASKVQRSRARGALYPYELVASVTGPGGSFVEHDLDATGRLVPVDRPPGRNTAGLVAGLVSTPTARYPEGMVRVALFGDPTKALGTVAEPECALVCAALDLAQERGLPVEWFALSSGARISMDSGTENMDWVARALRRLIEFTQAGGEVNVLVAGINVGAQPYWNAEATMLLHTKGILVMTPDSAMVLTGKQSLDYSGGVSAEDNFGIGGYDRVMGPNGQAQYWAPNINAACDVLFAHYEHTYVAPGERWPRPAPTTDPRDRDVRAFPHEHPASEFTTVGDIFSAQVNPQRKKPFDIRTVMRAVADADHPVLERWAGMADADTSVVFDAHLGGHPVELLGIESRPIPRRGRLAADGPDVWTAGTLFPRSSKKTARAINAASGNRPLVVLANLSGFDGSPESLRSMQLEYGAEIGRAMVNFRGPIVFCVISRYHGGAFVVFAGVLNDQMQVLAVEGSYASVIGGAPAAAVVFSGDVGKRTAADPRVRDLEAAVAAADPAEQARLRVELDGVRSTVRSEKLGEVAAEFEAVHDINRALRMGSVHAIVSAARLRPDLIDAVERGMARTPDNP